MWYLQNVWSLQQMLNETAEKLAVAVYDPSLDGRFEQILSTCTKL
jgi:predicted Rdx family selenoprotein